MRLLFLGSDPIALPTLDWLVKDARAWIELIGVYTQPDRPSGRGQLAHPNAIKAWAQGRRLPVFQPEKLTEQDVARVKATAADVALVMAYGQILAEPFIAAPRLGALNLHASILPKYRGASPVQTAIASLERTTGVCLMRIVRQLDAGPVADTELVSIGPLDTAADVEARLAKACPSLLARALPLLKGGGLAFVPQNPSQVTYCRRLGKEDGRLDWQAPAAALAARANGLFPWPACTIEAAGQIIKIGLADSVVAPGERAEAGQVVGSDADGLLVKAGDGLVRLRRLQRGGGRMLPAAEFLRGFSIPPGTRFASHPMAPLVSPRPFR
jgi:methionyl-tRNA formyltransferase